MPAGEPELPAGRDLFRRGRQAGAWRIRYMRHHRHRRSESPRIPALRTFARFVFVAIGGLVLWQAATQPQFYGYADAGRWSAHAQEQPPAAKADAESAPAEAAPLGGGPTTVFRFDVPIPITGLVDQQIESLVERALRKLPNDGPRPVFIFEFRPRANSTGEGSDFGRALTLARYIAGDRLSQARTVAWVPKTVKGHAVLPVLACEQIVMSKDADLGAAGIDETSIDPTVRRGYSEIAERRRTVPPAIALGLLDKDLGVVKVTTIEGIRYETADELPKLREEGLVSKEETVFQPGDHHVLSGAQMRQEYGFASHLAADRRELAAALQVPVKSLSQDTTPEEGWRPMRVDLSGPVHQKNVNWVLRAIEDHDRRGDCNLLFINIRSAGGNAEQSLRLAEQIASLRPRIHTVAYVDKQARADAAIVALACDELIAHPEAVLGGPGEANLSANELDALREPLAEIARAHDRDWSPMLALVDPSVELQRYTNALGNEVRFLTAEEAEQLPDPDQWRRDDQPVETRRGLTGQQAEEMGLARGTARNLEELKALYQLEGDVPEMQANWALAAIEWLADPKIAGLLLFIGLFALVFEMSTPGIGVPGFIALLCFILYFWSQFLHGTAHWLEILLFVAGITCVAIEIFALPGVGIFGIGGALMVITSIILASQTFVIPANEYQLRQFPVSLIMVAAGVLGGMASVAVIRRFLPDTPYFNRMLLRPPQAEEREALSRREALADYEHLTGKRGITATPLVPAGKAQFGDELVDVVSTGGELIPKGSPIIVEEIAGNRVVVRRA